MTPLFPRRRGFTFIEVLFAVILLGIGFILVAAVFPVALQQNQASSQDTNGTLIARGAIRRIQAVAFKANFPTWGNSITPFRDVIPGSPVLPGENMCIGADGFFSEDHRYAWAGFYRRTSPTSPYMQVWVVALQNPDFSDPDPASRAKVAPISPYLTLLTGGGTGTSSITATFEVDAGGNGTIQFQDPIPPNACEGAFVIVQSGSDNGVGDLTTPPAGKGPGPVTGRVYRLGNADPTKPGLFQQAPGFDSVPVNGSHEITDSPIPVFVIGRAPDASNGNAISNTSANQDLAVETSYVRFLDDNNQ